MTRRLRPGIRRPRWRQTGAAVLAVLLVLLAGCSGIPGGGSASVVSKVAAEPKNDDKGPVRGQPPDGIVRGFISASGLRAGNAGTGGALTAARRYLTPGAQGWAVGTATVIILEGDFRVDWDQSKPTEVSVTGTVAGTLDASLAYHEGNSVPFKQVLRMKKDGNGQWRIDDPPAQVVITQSDFTQNYQPRTLYFLDAGGTVVVPDQRYLNSAPDALPGRLLDLLIAGPAGLLAGVAHNRLTGAQLRTGVHPESGSTVVDITGVDLPTPASRRALAAQIVFTLTRYRDADQIVIMVGGDSLDPATPTYTQASLQSFDPDRVPATGTVASDPYYVNPQNQIFALTDNRPMWGDLGNGALSVLTAGMSAATGAVAATTVVPDGTQLVVGQPLARHEAIPVLKATTLTQPSFSRSGDEVWVVQNGADKPEVYQISATVSAAETPSRLQVAAPTLAGKGPVTALQISPDGVRVAVVAGQKLYLGAVSYSDQSATGDTSTSNPAEKSTAMLTNLTQVGTSLTDVWTVVFSTSTELLVAAKAPGAAIRTVFRESIDGSDQRQVTPTDLNNDVEGIAVSPSGPETGMYLDFGQRVYLLTGSVSDGRWITPTITTASVLSGTAPFYPS